MAEASAEQVAIWVERVRQEHRDLAAATTRAERAEAAAREAWAVLSFHNKQPDTGYILTCRAGCIACGWLHDHMEFAQDAMAATEKE